MVAPQKIKYNNICSNELNISDLIMCVAMDSDNGESPSFLNREAVSSESHDGRYKRIHRFKYTETFSPKFTFFKKDFSNFEIDEVRVVLKWLTSKSTTALLEAYYDDSNVVTWASIGGFVELQTYKLANNRTVAITAVWDSVSPFAFSDLYDVKQNVATSINTTMYYWTATTVSGTAIPQYVLTKTREVKTGTEVYSASRTITGELIDSPITFFGTISAVNTDGSFKINDAVFRLTSNGTKKQRTYNNKIIINIDTDDNKPVYPKVTINHGYGTTVTPHTIVPLLPHITFNSFVDMSGYVENTVYYNEAKAQYYWKTPEPQTRSSKTKPDYDGWVVVNVTRAYTEEDEYADKTFYYYDENQTYYWIDPFNFHVSSTPPSNFDMTSVKITNQHYGFFDVASDPITTVIKNNTGTETIILDGANKIVSSDRVRRVFGDDFNLQYLELYDGKNELTIEGNCEVTIEYREVRKIGEY